MWTYTHTTYIETHLKISFKVLGWGREDKRILLDCMSRRDFSKLKHEALRNRNLVTVTSQVWHNKTQRALCSHKLGDESCLCNTCDLQRTQDKRVREPRLERNIRNTETHRTESSSSSQLQLNSLLIRDSSTRHQCASDGRWRPKSETLTGKNKEK